MLINFIYQKIIISVIKYLNRNAKELENDNRLFAIDLLEKLGPRLRSIIKEELLRQELNNDNCKVNFL
jgi:hypothetical protein